MTSVDELRSLARKALAEEPLGGPGGKLPAIRLLREWTRGQRFGLRQIIDAVDWAIAQPVGGLTRADKENAVAVMAQRLERSARDFARLVDKDREIGMPSPGAIFADRACHRQRAALVRLAMARTVD